MKRNHFLIHNYSNKSDGKLSNLIFLPVVSQNLVLSKLPFEETDIIHGYLEFQTDEFYIFKDEFTENPKVETKGKYNSKIYFKASYCSKK